MRNYFGVPLILLIFVTACAPVNLPASTQILPTVLADRIVTAALTEQEQMAPSATMQPTTAIPPTATLQPTAVPTFVPTPMPALFDRAGFRQFAITRSYFPGFLDYLRERSYSKISSALSPDGNLIAISACWGSMDNYWNCETRKSGFLVVIDTNTGDLLTEIPLGEGWPGPLAFTPDGKSLLYSTDENKVVLWDLSTNKPDLTLINLTAKGSTIYPDVAVAPDGRSYAAVINSTLYVWNRSGEILLQTPAYQSWASAALSYSADGSRLVVFSPNRTGVDVYETSGWKMKDRFNLNKIRDASISPDGHLLAGINPLDNTAVVWDVDTGERLAELDPGLQANSVNFNPAGDLLIISGMGNLDHEDGYSTIGTVYETRTWSHLDNLYSFSDNGKVEFNRDGSRMAVFSSRFPTIWELPDAQLQEGFDVVQQFQAALHTGDYAAAASLFEVDYWEVESLTEMGIDRNDLAGSFKRLCDAQAIFCQPVKELVLMGYDWEDMVYLVRLTASDGGIFSSPQGAQVIYIYLRPGMDGQPRIIYPPQER